MNEILLPPGLPPSWLEQIRKAVLPSTSITLVSTLLGSSVIAALVGLGVNYLSEARKANVELAKTQAFERRESLRTLSNHLLALNRELDNLIATSQLLPRHGSNSKLSGYAKKSFDHSGEQMELISGDLKDPRISEDIEKEVKKILDALEHPLQQVQKDPKNIGELAELYDKELQTKIRRVQTQIDQTIHQIEL